MIEPKWKEWRDVWDERKHSPSFVSMFQKRLNEFSVHCIHNDCYFRAADGICVLPERLRFVDCNRFIIEVVV